METKFEAYEDEYGSIALFYDPENEHAWIQTTTWTDIER